MDLFKPRGASAPRNPTDNNQKKWSNYQYSSLLRVWWFNCFKQSWLKEHDDDEQAWRYEKSHLTN